MNDDRKIPTPAEFERAAAETSGNKFLRFFKRAKRFQVKQGVGESKDVLHSRSAPKATNELSPESPIPPLYEPPTSTPTPTVAPPMGTSFERGPAPPRRPSARRPINVSSEVKSQRGRSGAAARSKDETDWAPSWPHGLSEAELRKRIGSTQNYMEPD